MYRKSIFSPQFLLGPLAFLLVTVGGYSLMVPKAPKVPPSFVSKDGKVRIFAPKGWKDNLAGGKFIPLTHSLEIVNHAEKIHFTLSSFDKVKGLKLDNFASLVIANAQTFMENPQVQQVVQRQTTIGYRVEGRLISLESPRVTSNYSAQQQTKNDYETSMRVLVRTSKEAGTYQTFLVNVVETSNYFHVLMAKGSPATIAKNQPELDQMVYSLQETSAGRLKPSRK